MRNASWVMALPCVKFVGFPSTLRAFIHAVKPTKDVCSLQSTLANATASPAALPHSRRRVHRRLEILLGMGAPKHRTPSQRESGLRTAVSGTPATGRQPTAWKRFLRNKKVFSTRARAPQTKQSASEVQSVSGAPKYGITSISSLTDYNIFISTRGAGRALSRRAREPCSTPRARAPRGAP